MDATGLDLGERGRVFVDPNPQVGALLVDPQGNLIAEGAHLEFGGPHAEVNAPREAGERARGRPSLSP